MHQNNQKQKQKHIPVLTGEVLDYLSPKEGDSYLDLTAGYGGHAALILERTLQPQRATLVDRDQAAWRHLTALFGKTGANIMHADYMGASQKLLAEKVQFNLILADLGVSSPHFDNTERGFAISQDGPLDMRMDQSQELTAFTIVNNWGQAELEDILRRYGEEPKAKTIARLIASNRPVQTTGQLAQIVAHAWPGHSKIHPATRTFQALRIAVNDELGQLSNSLPLWLDLLAPGGRLAIISFHSLEDGIVKRFFAEHSHGYEASLNILTPKPVTGSPDELVFNPRARSARLRAAVKK